MKEQRNTDSSSGKLRLRTKEDNGMYSGMLQNPADPGAACRGKAGRAHRSCAANVEETAGENGSVVTDYQVEANNCSDSRFLQDALERMESTDPDHPVLMAADGAYGSEENKALAAKMNVELVTTDPGGQKPDPIFTDFIFPEDGHTVPACPAGHSPRKCGKPDRNGQMVLSSGRCLCAECPHRHQCKARIHKKVSSVCISLSKYRRARYFASRNTQEFKDIARFRNGVETVPVSLRRVCNVDRMLCRGKPRTAILVGCMIAARKLQKFMTFHRRTGNYV